MNDECTIRIGNYAEIRCLAGFEAKLVKDDLLVLTMTVEPATRIAKPKVVKLYVVGSALRQLKEALAGESQESTNAKAYRDMEIKGRAARRHVRARGS